MNIGDNIKLLRTHKKLTLKDLAEKATLSVSFISDIENGRRIPRLENLQKLAEALEVSISELTGEAIKIPSLNGVTLKTKNNKNGFLKPEEAEPELINHYRVLSNESKETLWNFILGLELAEKNKK